VKLKTFSPKWVFEISVRGNYSQSTVILKSFSDHAKIPGFAADDMFLNGSCIVVVLVELLNKSFNDNVVFLTTAIPLPSFL
jgi:hypothetical protein